MNAAALSSIDDYLAALRAALGNADAALVQDALYDAEEYLRSELAEQPQLDEAKVVARVASSYGSPEDVAAIYRDTEAKVSEALRTPPARPRGSLPGRFFGVAADPRAYAGLFYMLFALATGILYFTVAVTGVSLSIGLAILIIGVPFIVLFIGMVRVLSLVEGRLVETLLGERMPRRPLYADRGKPVMERIKAMFTDPRTWSTLLYFVLMLPLGIVYFTAAVVGLSLSVGFVAAPVMVLFGGGDFVHMDYYTGPPPAVLLPLLFVAGV
ncbi:MAG TPA: sensor domain-containing protein, partial [Xanthomonadales bacterium]|nr:sensor domain-containing protein [Xanthomonadales bacterium]